ncbi:hypothetical protein [Lutibacter sp. B1]|uniref:hypothetical protein n=1 Tax=Lutibacter sp. B1 TaxID=2725996 RepID=UPI0014571F1B|nr:hypothetical protein [Lutibacter sp. B1]NLP57644.1 hypothetical protein [Lutibacter sp. B1]
MEETKNSNYKIILIILSILLLGVLAYTYYNNKEYKTLTNAIEQEKEEIEQNLDSMIVKYENAIAQKTSMSNDLALERDKIIALRDSLKDIKATNYSLIRRYRNQIASLEETNKKLFTLNEALKDENEILAIHLDSANVKISKQIAKNDTLALQNLTLAEKVAIGSTLRLNKAKVIAMRERSNGKLVETSKSRNTDAFRINFTIAKNEIADQGDRQVYIQILDTKGNTVASKGELVLFDETSISYSDQTIVNYINEPVDIISLVEVDRDLIEAGVYAVNIYIENKLAGTTKIILK